MVILKCAIACNVCRVLFIKEPISTNHIIRAFFSSLFKQRAIKFI